MAYLHGERVDKIGAMIINFILGSVEPEGLETFM